MTSEAGIRKRSYLWSASQAILNAVQSAILLFAVARTQELEAAGVITIGFAIANLMMIIARYGIHNYQVTDTEELFRFSDYFYNRILSTLIAVFLSLGYLAGMMAVGRYSPDKSLVVLEIIILKLVDAFDDVYVARLQQAGRLDIGAGIAAIRLLISTALIFAMLWISAVVISLAAGILVSVLIDILLFRKSRKYTDYRVDKPDKQKLWSLMRIGFVLSLGTALHYYVGNTPKYLVDLYLDDRIQAIGGYIMIPAYMITVLNIMLMQPLVKSLGDVWTNGDTGSFIRMVKKHIVIIGAAAVLAMLLGVSIGLPVLSWFYRVELGSYQKEFICLMIGGGLYTLSGFYLVLLTVIRRQGKIVLGSGICLLVYLAGGRYAADTGGLFGLCLLYIAASAVLLAIFAFSMRKPGKMILEKGE